MKTMIDNLINGNLSDAKRQAKRFSEPKIHSYLRWEIGWSDARSAAAAHYLKTGQGFQAYCDAK